MTDAAPIIFPNMAARRVTVAVRTIIRTMLFAMIIVWSAFPILYIVISSFKQQKEIFKFPPDLIFTPTLEHYAALATKWTGFFPTLGNSLIVATGATILACFVSILSGFVYSRFANKILAGSVLYLIAIRLLPPIVVTLPLFPVVDALKLSDTHIVLIVLYAAFIVVVLSTVAAVGKVVGNGLALRVCGGGGVAGLRLDVGENGPALPRLRCVAE